MQIQDTFNDRQPQASRIILRVVIVIAAIKTLKNIVYLFLGYAAPGIGDLYRDHLRATLDFNEIIPLLGV